MQINITRKPKNTRYGSLAWAATLPANEWQWTISHRNDGSSRLDIYNGDLCLASLEINPNGWSSRFDECRITVDVTHIDDSIRYGGSHIGDALFDHLKEWADSLDLTIDDQGKMAFVSA